MCSKNGQPGGAGYLPKWLSFRRLGYLPVLTHRDNAYCVFIFEISFIIAYFYFNINRTGLLNKWTL